MGGMRGGGGEGGERTQERDEEWRRRGGLSVAGEQSQQRMDAVERRLDSEPRVRSEEGAHVGEEVKQQLHIHLVRVLRDPLTATKRGSREGAGCSCWPDQPRDWRDARRGHTLRAAGSNGE